MEEAKNFGVPIVEPNKYGIDLIMFREDDEDGDFSGWYLTTAPAFTVDDGDFCICEPYRGEFHEGRAFLIQNFSADEIEKLYSAINHSGGMAYKLNKVMNVKWEATA